MTKSDKKRVLAALDRWQAAYSKVDNDPKATSSDYLMAAVNWLRAMVKLGNEYLDDGAEDWADEHLVNAGVLVLSECRKLQGEIGAAAKEL
jgi:hypothetical protein